MQAPLIRSFFVLKQYSLIIFLVSKLSEQSITYSEFSRQSSIFASLILSEKELQTIFSFKFNNFFFAAKFFLSPISEESNIICLCKFDSSTKSSSNKFKTPIPDAAASGIGVLNLFDDDFVELSNLQRQIIFDSSDIGQYRKNQILFVFVNLIVQQNHHQINLKPLSLMPRHQG